jgi:uncharacterized membrane protein YfcA
MSTRVPHPTEIEAGLEEIRIRWRLVWFLTAAMLLAFVLFAGWALYDGRFDEEWPRYVTGLVGGSLVVNLAWGRVVLSRCPRCGERFYIRDSLLRVVIGQAFGGRCVHCGLELRRDRR